ncbi:hypothetical protein EV424DRAFT_1399134, partial [Suillus variegatus]
HLLFVLLVLAGSKQTTRVGLMCMASMESMRQRYWVIRNKYGNSLNSNHASVANMSRVLQDAREDSLHLIQQRLCQIITSASMFAPRVAVTGAII